jgi:hypothetical protein
VKSEPWIGTDPSWMVVAGDERTIGVGVGDAYDPEQIKDVGLTTCEGSGSVGFMDKAKAAANELAAKADTALAGSGPPAPPAPTAPKSSGPTFPPTAPPPPPPSWAGGS